MEEFFQKLWDDIFSLWNLENILRGGGADSLGKCNYTVLEKSFDSVLLNESKHLPDANTENIRKRTHSCSQVLALAGC